MHCSSCSTTSPSSQPPQAGTPVHAAKVLNLLQVKQLLQLLLHGVPEMPHQSASLPAMTCTHYMQPILKHAAAHCRSQATCRHAWYLSHRMFSYFSLTCVHCKHTVQHIPHVKALLQALELHATSATVPAHNSSHLCSEPHPHGRGAPSSSVNLPKGDAATVM
jgi:hypothetical protein